MTLVLTFLLIFVAGPFAYWCLARHRASNGEFLLLVGVSLTLTGLSFALPRWAGQAWQNWEYFGAALVAFLWLGWVCIMALSVQAVRRKLPVGRSHAWAFALGAMATTLPWFGLHLAEVVAA